jgi:hypothetical protein
VAQVRVDFSGTTVFVAGGTSGINLGIARRIDGTSFWLVRYRCACATIDG